MVNTKKVQELIDNRGWKNLYVAQQLGVREGKFSFWMTSRSEPTPSQLHSLATLLGVTVPEICDENGQTKIPSLSSGGPFDAAKINSEGR